MKKLWLVLASVMSFASYAGTPDFNQLTKGQLESISEEFSANFVPTTVSGASNMGRLWGFEVGLMATQSASDEIERISSDNFSDLYNAALYGRVDVIYGLGAEIVMSPLEVGDIELKNYSMAFKWTLTEVFKSIPFNIMVKVFFNNADLGYVDNRGTGDFDVAYDYEGRGINFTFSKKLLLVEPYVGFGYISGESDITTSSSTGNSIIFDPSVVVGQDNVGIETSGAMYYGGVTANLLAFQVGLEYSNVLGVDRISGKLGFGF